MRRNAPQHQKSGTLILYKHFWGTFPISVHAFITIYDCFVLYNLDIQYSRKRESHQTKKSLFLTLESTRRRVSVAVYTTTTNRRAQITWIYPLKVYSQRYKVYVILSVHTRMIIIYIIFHVAVRVWNLGHNNNTI